MLRIRLWALLGILSLGASACRHIPDSELQSESPNRASALRQAVIERLDAKHGSSRGELWGPSSGNLAADAILQTPNDYWGKSQAELPKGLDCTTLGQNGCDAVFPRKVCESDSDCLATNTHCRLMEASASPILPARKMCQGSGDYLVDRVYRVMTSSQERLEFTSLSMPTGIFRLAFVNALAELAKRDKPPEVRILVSGEDPVAFNQIRRAQMVLDKLWDDMGTASGEAAAFAAERWERKTRMKMNLGYVAFGSGLNAKDGEKMNFNPTSWNHSKIIIADGQRMIQGGHNLWGDVYAADEPVSDLSMETDGPIAGLAQSFVNALWAKVDSESTVARFFTPLYGELPNRAARLSDPRYVGDSRQIRSGESYRLPDYIHIPDETGKVAMIAIGRMGAFSNGTKNPSDDALKALVESSQSKVQFVIQDLYGLISNIGSLANHWAVPIEISNDPTWLLPSMAIALQRGAKIEVVQSDTDIGPNGYTLINYLNVYRLIVRDLQKLLKANGFVPPNGQTLKDFVCQRFDYAPYRYTAGLKRWGSGGGFGSHAKMVMVDESAYYIGSHNFYNANLQEFGVIVADQPATLELKRQLWEPLWRASEPDKSACP